MAFTQLIHATSPSSLQRTCFGLFLGVQQSRGMPVTDHASDIAECCATRFATGTQNGGLAIRNPRESGECFANVGRCHLTMFAESDDGIMYHAIQLALEDFVVPFGQSFRIDKKTTGN